MLGSLHAASEREPDDSTRDHLLHEYIMNFDIKDKTSRWRLRGITICLLINGLLLLSIVFLLGMAAFSRNLHRPAQFANFFSSSLSQSLQKHTPEWKDCGRSPEEAVSKGCHYDVLLVAWVHADCFDADLMESYLAEVDYPFWLDRSLQQSTTLEEVRKGIHKVVYSNQEFHMAHCAYFLEMSIRGFRKSDVYDNTTLDMEHTKHCARTLRDHWLPDLGYSPLHMVWHSCGR